MEVQVLLVHRNSNNLRIFCSQWIARMPSEFIKSLLIFTWVDLSDKEHMIQAGIANRGKSFLASIVLALFVFGVIQMLTRTWASTFFFDCSACVGLKDWAIDLLLELLSIQEGVSSCILMSPSAHWRGTSTPTNFDHVLPGFTGVLVGELPSGLRNRRMWANPNVCSQLYPLPMVC